MTQAMLLAAGYSTRLRPFTDNLPKPLLPFWDRTILDFLTLYLRNAGVTEIAVNVHHAPEPFKAALKKLDAPKPTIFEEEEILGTGGGIFNMRSFVTDETFCVLNCDFLTDLDLGAAIAFHKKRNALATMVLVNHPEASRYGEIGTNRDGTIVDFPYASKSTPATAKGMFTGIHIFHRNIFDEMSRMKPIHINRDVYGPLIKRGAPIFGYHANRRWFDIGDIPTYARSQFELLSSPLAWMKGFLESMNQPTPGVYVSSKAKLGSNVTLTAPALISDDATVGDDVSIGPNTIIGASCSIEAESTIEDVVLFPDSAIPKKSDVRKQLLSATPAKRKTAALK